MGNIAREWRLKWSPDNDKASLAAAQGVVNEYIDVIKKVNGVLSVQRVVCGGCLDYKLITKLGAADFQEWEKGNFGPEEEVLGKLKAIEGVTNVETQTYTLEDM